MTKVIGQSSLMKPQAKKGQKKISAKNNQETWAKENKKKAPKMKTKNSRNGLKLRIQPSMKGNQNAFDEV